MPHQQPTEAPDLTFLQRALEKFETVDKAESTQRDNQLKDYKFSIGEQWDDADKGLRAGRPMLVNNRTGQYIRQTTNQARQSRPAIQINPVDSGSDPETAEILQGLIRHIETDSDADTAYSTASDWQVRSGVGYVRVVPEYIDETGENDNQKLCIKAIRNRFTVFDDPAAVDPSGADRNIAFIVEDLEDEEYQRRYPDSEMASTLRMFESVGAAPAGWYRKGHVRVAEVFVRELTRTTLKREPPAIDRVVEKAVVKWAVINGVEILEGNDDKSDGRVLPIPFIPLARAVGDVYDLDGVVDFRGITREAKDPQKLANYMDSATAEMIALAPKAPYVGAEGQFEGHPEWDTANSKNWSKLEYKPTVDGVAGMLPPPQRQAVEPPIQAMAIVGQRAENNLRAVIGFVDVQEQERRAEQSGKAILARQRQGELSNSHYLDNLGRMIRHVGRILVAWVPHIYDAPRVMRILGNDDQAKTVMIHAGNPPDPSQPLPPGVDKIYDLSMGKYDVTISVGQAFQTKRQEAFDAIGQIIQAAPQMLQIFGDLYFENMDVPAARQMGERLKMMLPPQLQDEQQGQPPIPPQVQQQMQQLMQQHELLT